MTAGPQYREGQQLELAALRQQIKRLRRWLALTALLAALGAFAGAAGLLSGRSAVGQVNSERARNIVRTCTDTGKRHDAAIGQLRRLVAAIPERARRERAEDGMAGTIALIDALVPKQNCKALVERQVDTK